jgi:hypothetical protein
LDIAGGGSARRVEIPDEDHYTVILALSRREGVAGPSVVEFVSDTRCEATKRG